MCTFSITIDLYAAPLRRLHICLVEDQASLSESQGDFYGAQCENGVPQGDEHHRQQGIMHDIKSF